MRSMWSRMERFENAVVPGRTKCEPGTSRFRVRCFASHRNDDQGIEIIMTKLTDATREKLKTVSTATVATALFKRGFRIQMIQDVHPLGANQPVLVGEAFTLRYMPAR